MYWNFIAIYGFIKNQLFVSAADSLIVKMLKKVFISKESVTHIIGTPFTL
jgi:hypothetical protein